MSFDHEHPNRKDRRKPYRGAKSCDPSCRPHGSCPWCAGNRLHKHERRAPADDPEGDDGILWDDQYLSDHLLSGERLPMFFDDPDSIPYFRGHTMKTADGVEFSQSMPLWTLDGDRCERDLSVTPPKHGDSLWIEFVEDGDDRGSVLSILYSSEEAAKAARDSPRNSCFRCGKHLELCCSSPQGEGIGAIWGGLYFRATGNFGSAVLDGPDHEFIEIVICDGCVAANVDRLRYWSENGGTEHGIGEAYAASMRVKGWDDL